MTALDIITKFEEYMDDTTELSSAEELDLLNKIYQRVSYLIPWESLKKVYTSSGAIGGTTDTLPPRFGYLIENDNYTANGEYGTGPVIYVGEKLTPFKVVSFSDRRNYRNQNNYAYLDVANNNLVFTKSPGDIIEYDYIEYPPDLTTGDTPWIPERFQHILYHGMCIDDFIIQQSEKARSYRNEHLANFNMYLTDMKSWNNSLVQMN